MTRVREHGFTLLELIVAAAILALIAVFSWRGLDALIREREALAASQASVDVLERTFARIERDALLARDVELDGEGTMRLVAGSGAAEGADAATVAYRWRDGALVRTVAGAGGTPVVLVDGVASLAMEAWTPAPRGGAWVRSRSAVPEPSRAAAPAAAQNATAQSTPQSAAPGTAIAPQPSEGVPPQSAVAAPAQQNPLAVPATAAAATGIRLTLGLADGSRVVRAFLVGGA